MIFVFNILFSIEFIAKFKIKFKCSISEMHNVRCGVLRFYDVVKYLWVDTNPTISRNI
jgi:hypothetical protein